MEEGEEKDDHDEPQLGQLLRADWLRGPLAKHLGKDIVRGEGGK